MNLIILIDFHDISSIEIILLLAIISISTMYIYKN